MSKQATIRRHSRNGILCCLLGIALVNADHLPAGQYLGNLTQHTAAWQWQTPVYGSVDKQGHLTLIIPRNPYFSNLVGTLDGEILASENGCTLADGLLVVDHYINSPAGFQSCAWDGEILHAEFSAVQRSGDSITGQLKLYYYQGTDSCQAKSPKF